MLIKESILLENVCVKVICVCIKVYRNHLRKSMPRNFRVKGSFENDDSTHKERLNQPCKAWRKYIVKNS